MVCCDTWLALWHLCGYLKWSIELWEACIMYMYVTLKKTAVVGHLWGGGHHWLRRKNGFSHLSVCAVYCQDYYIDVIPDRWHPYIAANNQQLLYVWYYTDHVIYHVSFTTKHRKHRIRSSLCALCGLHITVDILSLLWAASYGSQLLISVCMLPCFSGLSICFICYCFRKEIIYLSMEIKSTQWKSVICWPLCWHNSVCYGLTWCVWWVRFDMKRFGCEYIQWRTLVYKI